MKAKTRVGAGYWMCATKFVYRLTVAVSIAPPYPLIVNKQLNDKERVAAALENNHLLEVVHECLQNASERGGQSHGHEHK